MLGEAATRHWRLFHRHDEAIHDVIFPLRRVLAHVEIEDRPGLVAWREFHTEAVRQHLKRICLPMNCANSFRLISPTPLNRVISGLPPSEAATGAILFTRPH